VTRTRVLTIAGSDPSGGAGQEADLATIAAFGCHGMSVVTGLTVQDSRRAHGVWPVDAAVVRRQIDALFEDCAPAAAKTGALATVDLVRAVIDAWTRRPGVPLVVDPVVASSSGLRLIDAAAEREILTRLVPLAVLVTPNAVEAAAMTGVRIVGIDGAVTAARRLVERGARAALVKGGHLDGRVVTDVLVEAGTSEPVFFERPRIVSPRRVRGTGCALSAAVAAGLARGLELRDAVRVAGDWVHAAIAGAYATGSGALSLDRPTWAGKTVP
jgi:hydroxymethylpyrimidine/phosphomethylpyrimidine kinase